MATNRAGTGTTEPGGGSALCVGVCDRDSTEIGTLILFLKNVSNLGQKVSDVVIFGVIYLRSSGASVLVVVVP